MDSKKTCITCGDHVQGRSDKKYCSNDCRSNYNNFQNREKNNLMRNINRALRKNHHILEQLVCQGNSEVHRNTLLNLGYNFIYSTHVMYNATGQESRCCYGKGILETTSQSYAIVDSNSLQTIPILQYESSNNIIPLSRLAISR